MNHSYSTAWTKKTSSVPSDRIRPKASADTKANAKATGKRRQEEPTKSKEVRKLESLLAALQESAEVGKRAEKDPNGGCFCLARTHDLSPYVKLCTSCGFILCAINLPNFACPSCHSVLLSASASTALIARLESERAETLAREAEARRHAAEEAQKAAGAFPTLSAKGVVPLPPPPLVTPQAHKVLSLNSKTRQVTVSSYSPGPSRPVSRGLPETDAEDEPVRVPPPSADVVYAKKRVSAERPWENLSEEETMYIPPARVDGRVTENMGEKGKSRSQKKKER